MQAIQEDFICLTLILFIQVLTKLFATYLKDWFSGVLCKVQTPPTQSTPMDSTKDHIESSTPMDSNGLQWEARSITFQISNSNGLQWTPMDSDELQWTPTDPNRVKAYYAVLHILWSLLYK